MSNPFDAIHETYELKIRGFCEQVSQLTESNRQLREELETVKKMNLFSESRMFDENARIHRALAAAKEALEKVKLKGHLGNHGHWDSSMRSGAGCPLCIDQNTVRAEVNFALARIAECEDVIT